MKKIKILKKSKANNNDNDFVLYHKKDGTALINGDLNEVMNAIHGIIEELADNVGASTTDLIAALAIADLTFRAESGDE